MSEILVFVKRNVKLFFKDKGVFFTSLITPLILLLLYVTFLGNVYKDSYMMIIPEGFSVSDNVIGALVGGQLFSSLLAVCCVTVSFCSNMIMVSDKVSGATTDFGISPIRSSRLAFGYYIATLISTLSVCLLATAVSFIYIATKGWFLSTSDVFLILLDIFILVMFGTALSSLINFFLSSQGQISAVGSIVSSTYGFVCGAYMPISNFAPWLQNAIAFLPGTYGTSLLRHHSMRGALAAAESEGLPSEIVETMKNLTDCNIYFFDNKVSDPVKYAVLIGGMTLILVFYIMLCRNKKTKMK